MNMEKVIVSELILKCSWNKEFLIIIIKTIGCYKKSEAGTEDLKSSSWGGKVIGIYIDESLS